jgi:PilZ domain-containing protein
MGSDKRRNPRIGMTIAVRVQGFLPGGATWEEVTQTDDVSSGGASINLKHDVELGQALFLNLAMPKRLRQYDLTDATYRVYALVRGISRRADDNRVGLMFFGKFPPRGFHETPWARFLLPSDSGNKVPPLAPSPTPAEGRPPIGPSDTAPVEVIHPATPPSPPASPSEAFPPPSSSQATPAAARPAPAPAVPSDPTERRAHPRFQIFKNFTIQQVDEWGAVLQEEMTVADNLSKGGAHVMTSLEFMKGDVILIQEQGGGFATRAEIRAIVKGADRISRLHLKFLDRQAPDRLLKA